MSRYTVAVDLTSWRERQRSRKKRRTSAHASKARREPGARAPKRREKTEKPSGPPRHDLEPAEALGPRGGPRRGPHPGGRRGHDAIRGDDVEVLHEAALEEGELEAVEPEDLGEEPAPRHRKVRDRVHDAVSRDWQRPQDLGSKMRIQTRAGTRAAIIEVKPGLFVVAEVPVESVEFGFGPMLLAPALIKTLGRALQGSRSAGGAGRAHRPELSARPQRQLPGPTEEQDQTEGRLAPWLDADVAEELGCPCEVRRDRRKP